MDRAFKEMQQLKMPESIISSSGMEMSVLERRQAMLNYMNANGQMSTFPTPVQVPQFPVLIGPNQGVEELVSPSATQDSRWSELSNVRGVEYCSSGVAKGSRLDMNYLILRTVSCPPAGATAMAESVTASSKGKEFTGPETLSSVVGTESSRKRKVQSQKTNTDEEPIDKKMKGSGHQSESKTTERCSRNKKTASSNSNKDHSADTSKENSRVTEDKKPDYIHVRARRGQATDSHSLAERVRREKISERMKYLQELVPGCSKIVGKAGMLDEIINYVQSLQKQVEFLSMKLAAVNPTSEFNIDSLFPKEMIPAGTMNFSTTGLSSEMANPIQLQFNPFQQIVSCSGIETVVTHPDRALQRAISDPVTMPETLLDQSCFNQIQHLSTSDAELTNLYTTEFHQGKSVSFFPQAYTGYVEPYHVKLQM